MTVQEFFAIGPQLEMPTQTLEYCAWSGWTLITPFGEDELGEDELRVPYWINRMNSREPLFDDGKYLTVAIRIYMTDAERFNGDIDTLNDIVRLHAEGAIASAKELLRERGISADVVAA